MSWDYPPKFSLRKKIDEGQLYPITCLTTLTIVEKDKLMVLDVILAREIIDNAEIAIKLLGSSDEEKALSNSVLDADGNNYNFNAPVSGQYILELIDD